MIEQLPLLMGKTAAPKVKPEEVKRIVDLLLKAEGWLTKRQLAESMVLQFCDTFNRRLRAIAEVGAPTIVSWPGSPGLKHWNFATVEEINHAIEAHESQGKLQFKRANVYRLAYHRRHRVEVAITPELEACLTGIENMRLSAGMVAP